MIQATDLKIGNWFIGYDNKPFAWELADFGAMNKGIGIDEIIKMRIKLTSEILAKCGFEKKLLCKFDEWEDCFAKWSLVITQRRNLYFIDWLGGNTQIEYLHELQNVHYALLKEELEFKP